MVELKIGVMTTKGRENYLYNSLSALKNDEKLWNVEVFKDLKPGVLCNSLASWHRLFSDKKVEFAVLIQDDIDCSYNTLSAIELFCENLDFDLMLLFSNSKEIISQKPGLIEFKSSMPGYLGFVMSRKCYEEYCDYLQNGEFHLALKEQKRKYSTHIPNDDRMLMVFLDYKKELKKYAVNPVILQHTGKKSTLGHNWIICGMKRESRNYLGTKVNAKKYFKKVMNWK